MGLDQYLEARKYISGHEWEPADKQKAYDTISAALGFTPDDVYRRYVIVGLPVGYWRKANQIHHWFVENVQAGVDDCGTYSVSLEQLGELRDLCNKVIDNPDLAEKLLPTTSGFFFGDTTYDEYYFQELQSTVDIINRCLGDEKLSGCDFQYQSSW